LILLTDGDYEGTEEEPQAENQERKATAEPDFESRNQADSAGMESEIEEESEERGSEEIEDREGVRMSDLS
jgi:hypothetical protein